MEKMKEKIDKNIINWNGRFPLDRWWRNKYKIPFLSTNHRESSFYSQYFEFFEDKFFERLSKKEEQKSEELQETSSEWWTGKQLSNSEIDDWFNS